MKRTSKISHLLPLSLALTVSLLLSGCGKLQSERKQVSEVNKKAFLLANGQPLTSQEFKDACYAKGSLVNDICVWVSDVKELGTNSADVYKDIQIGDFPSGIAIEASGTVYNRSVEVLANGQKLLDVPSRRTTINGGRLAWRIRPGSYHSVKLLIISCVNQNNTPVRCPEF